jgi:hypothetical protein
MKIREKTRNKIKKESLATKILNHLGETSIDFLKLSARIVFDPKGLAKDLGFYGGHSYPRYYPRQISNLKRSSYFLQDGAVFYLSEKGRAKIIKNILINKKMENHKWRGFWLGIIFDIPEANRSERSFLRRELKYVGCKELQKSVWITPFDIKAELMTLLKLWKKDFRGDIRFLEINQISDEEELKKDFNIK